MIITVATKLGPIHVHHVDVPDIDNIDDMTDRIYQCMARGPLFVLKDRNIGNVIVSTREVIYIHVVDQPTEAEPVDQVPYEHKGAEAGPPYDEPVIIGADVPLADEQRAQLDELDRLNGTAPAEAAEELAHA